MANMNNMLRQAQALQRKMQKAQEELAELEVTGSAGGGTVTATASGNGALKAIEISREVVDPDDVELLQDLVVAAVHEAVRKAKELEEEHLGGLTAGLGLPPGLM